MQGNQTALHVACRRGHVEVVRMLINRGASVDLKDVWGKTQLDVAKKHHHGDIVRLLEKAESDDDLKSESDGEGTSSDEASKDQIEVPLGHILTKFELQVLSGLLDAYSNEKIKEIQQSIRKKRGGDMSREEVERSLREGGLTTVADELEQNLHKHVEKAEHYEAYKAALEGAETLTLRYLRFLFFGPPRSGKSTMRRRMLQEIINLSRLGQPSVSTGVADAFEIVIKKMTSETTAISGSQWYSLKKSSKGDDAASESMYGEIGLDYLAQMFYHLIYKSASLPVSHNESNPGPPDSPAHIDSSGGSQEATEGGDNTSSETSSAQNEVKHEECDESAIPAAVDMFTSSSEKKEVDKAFEDLTDILKADTLEEFYQLLEALTLINMTDVGGQPEFLDMLPALTIGAALYLLFFRLDQDLHERYPVTFLAPGDSSEITLETSYCIEEVIHQALASIACFGCYSTTTGESASSCAALIGTYRDQVTPAEIAKKKEDVTKQFFSSELCKKLLLKTNKGQPFFTVDNMNGTDESEMTEIRSNIEQIVKSFFAEVPIPASWLMFRILLHLLYKPVVSLAQCEDIAHRLSMPTPVQEALWFFHHNIGSLLYYPDIPSVKDLVICSPQVIFDSITTVIIDKFKHTNYLVSNDVREQFQHTGLFSLSDITKKTKHDRSTYLSPEQLLDVLKHNGILAEVKYDEEKSTSTEPVESKFIIPAVLKHANEEELKAPMSLKASPLIIHFKGGFVPFGVFSASIARLIAFADSLSPKWCLHGKEVKRNKVKFLIAGAFIATLISRPQHLEIQIEQHPRAATEHSLAEICFITRQTIVETIETTISKMKYRPQTSVASMFLSSQQPLTLAFTCCLHDSEPDYDHHFMKIDANWKGECLVEKFKVTLRREHLLWFNQDKTLSQAEIIPTSNLTVPLILSENLSINDLVVVQNHTWTARAEWYNCGLALGLLPDTLDAIERTHKGDCGQCYTQTLKTWLRNANPQPTLRALCDALQSPSVGHEELAEKLLVPKKQT